MKNKIGSLLAVGALLLGGGVVRAQGTLEKPVVGAVKPEVGKKYYLYNVDTDAWLSSGGSWGTHAIVDQIGRMVTLGGVEGAYTLEFSPGRLLYRASNGIFTDRSYDCDWNLTENSNVYTLAFGDKKLGAADEATIGSRNDNHPYEGVGQMLVYDNHTDWQFVEESTFDLYGAKKVMYSLLNENGDVSDMDSYKTIYNTASSSAELWNAMSDLLTATATETDPVDVTAYLKNPSFEQGMGGWTVNGTTNDVGLREPVSSWYTTDLDGKFLYNTWSAGLGVQQTIANLPAGKYRLTVAAASGNATQGGHVTLYGGGLSNTIETQPGSTALIDYTLDFIHAGGDLVVGTADQGEWYKADNFRLAYLGRDMQFVQDQIKEINDYLEEITVPADVRTQVEAYINEAEKLTSTSSESDIQKALLPLKNECVELINKGRMAHTTLQALIDRANELSSRDGYTGIDGLKEAIEAAKHALQNQYGAETYTTLYGKIREFALTAPASAETGLADMTEMIVNHSFEDGEYGVIPGFDSVNDGYNGIYGWTLGGSIGGEVAVKPNDGIYRMSAASGKYLFNTYPRGLSLQQELQGLPAGLYLMDVAVASDKNRTITPFIDNVSRAYMTTQDANTGEIIRLGEVKVAEGESLVLGTKAQDDWYKVDNFRLYRVADCDTYINLLIENSSDVDAAFLLYKKATEEALAAIESGDKERKENAILALSDAIRKYREGGDLTGGAVDLSTELLPNGDFSDGTTYWNIESVTGIGILDGEYYTGERHPYLDTNANGVNRINSTIDRNLTLTEGKYRLSFIGRGHPNVDLHVLLVEGEEPLFDQKLICVDNTAGTLGRGWHAYNVDFEISQIKTVTLRIHAECGSWAWFSVGDFKLQRMGDHAIAVNNGRVKFKGEFDADALNEYSASESHTYVDLTEANITAETATITLTNPNAIVNCGDKDIDVAGANKMVNGVVENMSLTDGHPFATPIAFTAGRATYTRPAPKNAWGTLMLPYAVQSDENIKLYHLLSVTADVMTFEEVEGVEACTPCVYKRVVDGDVTLAAEDQTIEITREGVYDKTDDNVEDWKMHGVLNDTVIATKDQPEAYYAISDNKFYQFTEELTVGAFRAYFTASAPAEATASVMSIRVDVPGEATGVEETIEGFNGLAVFGGKGELTLKAGKAVNYTVYDEAGRSVATGRLAAGASESLALPAGLYIVNGAKVCVGK